MSTVRPVVGLDLSLRATGIATATAVVTVGTRPDAGDRRLVQITDAVSEAVADRSALVVIEDLPTHAKSAGLTGMLHGAVRAMLLRRAVDYVTVPPSTLKKFATGRGNCGKPEMAVALYKRAGVELRDDNQVDAWWLRTAGLALLGAPCVSLPAAQRAALDKVVF